MSNFSLAKKEADTEGVTTELSLVRNNKGKCESDRAPQTSKRVLCKNFTEIHGFILSDGGLNQEKIDRFSRLAINQNFLKEQSQLMATVTEEEVQSLKKALLSEATDACCDLLSYIKKFPEEKHQLILDDVFVIKMLVLIEKAFKEDKEQYRFLKEYFIYILPVFYHPIKV